MCTFGLIFVNERLISLQRKGNAEHLKQDFIFIIEKALHRYVEAIISVSTT